MSIKVVSGEQGYMLWVDGEEVCAFSSMREAVMYGFLILAKVIL